MKTLHSLKKQKFSNRPIRRIIAPDPYVFNIDRLNDAVLDFRIRFDQYNITTNTTNTTIQNLELA
jgi:hypothetical protein